MYLPITATKTYSQWKTENPDFYDDLISEGLIDEATVSSIDKWFKYRTVCDDVRFTEFFERQLDLCLPRYNKLIRLENTEFDALVNTYRERQVIGISTSEGSTSRSGSRTGESESESTTEVVRTPALVTTDEGQAQSTSESTSTGHNETDTTGGTTHENINVSKVNPQSISYSGAALGNIPDLNWEYPSSQNQSKSVMQYNDDHVEGNNTSATDGSSSSLNSNTNRLTGTDTTESTVNATSTEGETTSETIDTEGSANSTTREIYTGRDGLAPQEALARAMRYVKTSSAFVWLKDNLELCFLSVYDI